jgi:hypothetical protein
MVLAAYADGLYKLFFLGHIVSLLVAFAPAVVNPLLTAQTKRDGEQTLIQVSAHMAANSRRLHFPALVALGGFGLAMVFASGEAWSFDQLWVSLALLVWIAIAGLVSGVIVPAERRLGAGDLAAEARVAMGGQIVTVLTLVMLYLMIWKPGA